MKEGRGPIGVVLAGGASRRMGEDKARLEVGGTPLIERAIAKLEVACREVLVADGGRGLVTGRQSVPDGPGKGPAAGILGAAARQPGRSLLVLACDLPMVPLALLERLASDDVSDWVVPRWAGRLEPLCALYRPNALVALAAHVGLGIHAPHRLTEQSWLEVRFVEGTRLGALGEPARMFLNINSPSDLVRAREIVE